MMKSNNVLNTAPLMRKARPVAAILLTAVTAVALSATSSRAAELYGTGLNAYGEIGNGTQASQTDGSGSPTSLVKVTGMNFGITAFGGGAAHSLMIKSGALYATGLENYGEIGNGFTAPQGENPPVFYTVTTPQLVSGLTSGVTAVAVGQFHSFAIANGGLYSFGGNNNGVLGNGTAPNTSTANASAVVGLGSGVTAIATGATHALAIQNGALYSWGGNVYGQLGNGASGSTSPNVTAPAPVSGFTSGVTLVAAGPYHSLAVMNNVLYGWGNNQNGAVGNNGPSGYGVPEALNGTPSAVVGLPSGGNITAIAASGYAPGGITLDFSMALVNGAVYAWGSNDTGQLGNGTLDNRPTAGLVPGITGTIVDITTAGSAGYALGADGTVWDWGSNVYGRLGLGTTKRFYLTPQHLFAQTGYRFSAISGGSTASHVLMSESALPVYFNGLTSGTLTDVSNYSKAVDGLTAAPIAPVESTDIFFGTTNANVANLTATVGTSMVANTLTFGTGVSASNAVTINGGTITLYADKNTYAAGTGIVVQSGAAAATINAAINVGQSQSWTNSSASLLTVNGAVGLGTQNLTLAGTGNTTVGGAISGSGAVKIVSNGTTTFSGANTYSGITTVTAGTLRATTAAYGNLLTNAGGLDLQGGKVVFDYTGGTTPLTDVKTILTNEYNTTHTAAGFATGQIRTTVRPAGSTLGYRDFGGAVTVRLTLPGDSNLDGTVDFSDFLLLQANYTHPDTTFGQGNFNYDGVTDFSDFLMLQVNFGHTFGGSDVAVSADQLAALHAFAVANVPEPTLLALAGLGMAAALKRKRRA